MGQRWLLTGLVLVASVATACSSQAAEGGVAPSSSPADDEHVVSPTTSAAQTSPEPDSGATSHSHAPEDDPGQLPEQQIETVDLPEGYPEEVTVQEGGSALEILGREGGCSDMHADLTQQGPERVTVALVETEPADKTVACTADIRSPVLTVELAEPLNDRTVVLQYEQRWE